MKCGGSCFPLNTESQLDLVGAMSSFLPPRVRANTAETANERAEHSRVVETVSAVSAVAETHQLSSELSTEPGAEIQAFLPSNKRKHIAQTALERIGTSPMSNDELWQVIDQAINDMDQLDRPRRMLKQVDMLPTADLETERRSECTTDDLISDLADMHQISR